MRIAKSILSSAVSIALLFWLFGLFAPTAQTAGQSNASSPVTVSVNAPTEAPTGGIFTASVSVSRVDNFDAGNYDVSFSPSVLALENVTAGQIGQSQIPVDVWNRVSVGVVRIVQNVPGIAGVSGSGSLATLHFRVIGSGGQSSSISLSNGMLSNNLAEAIAATWGSGSVQVVSGQSPDQRTQQTPPTPSAGTTQAPSATSNATSVTSESSLRTPEDSAAIGAPKAASVSPQPTVVSSPPAVVPAAPPVLGAGPQPSETQRILKVASPAVNEAPLDSPLALRRTNQVNRAVIGAIIAGFAFIIGMVISLFAARRRSR